MEIEIRAGFCDPDGELLAVLERSGWRRITAQRRGEIVGEMVRVCERPSAGSPRRGRRRDDGSAAVRDRLLARGRPAERAMTTNRLAADDGAGRSSDRAARAGPDERGADRAGDPGRPGDDPAWLERREAPAGCRLSDSQSSWRSSRRWRATFAATPSLEWLDATVDVLDGANPLDEIAGGGYERMIQFALGLTYGVFT